MSARVQPQRREVIQERPPVPEATATGLRAFISNHWDAVLIVGFVIVAFLLRFWDLGSRAMHHDESLHATYSWYLYTGKGYRHDPMMHGPFQFHFNALVFFLLGASDYTVRVLPAIFGTALVGLPYLFRDRLGRYGAVVASFFLLISPTMLYFSRFARNDIYTAVWDVALAMCIWRYLASRKPPYLFATAAVLAFSFATKETSYITVVIFGSFLVLMMLWELAAWLSQLRAAPKLKPKRASDSKASSSGLLLAVKGLPTWLRGGYTESDPSGVLALLLLFFTLSFPLGSAIASLFQDRLGVTLANPAENWTSGPVGAPMGDGIYLAFLSALAFIAIAAAIGLRWNWRLWVVYASVFWGIYLLLFTTFFTNLVGVGTGIWQSLGYWLAQQEVSRGSQPWYYYLLIVPLYEFLPLIFALAGLVYYAYRSKDLFNWFLIYWALATLLLYTRAGEKMPWLSLHVALPFIILGGKFLGDILSQVRWKETLNRGGAIFFLLVPLFLLLGASVFEIQPSSGAIPRSLEIWARTGVASAVFFAGVYLSRRVGWQESTHMVVVAVAIILSLFTIRAALTASYQHGDIPMEMLVYTQTSPDIPRVMRDIDRLAQETNQREKLKITIDGADGFVWPWVWYLRDYKAVETPDFSSGISGPPSGQVVIINARNEEKMKPYLDNYSQGQRIRLRWWFPEDYRELTVEKLLKGLANSDARQKVWDYFWQRKTPNPLGSADSIVYFPKGFKQG